MMNFRIEGERNFGFPDEAYANKFNKMLGVLSPARCLVIQMGGYGPDVLKKILGSPCTQNKTSYQSQDVSEMALERLVQV